MSELSPELGDFSMSLQALIAQCVEQGTGNIFYLSLQKHLPGGGGRKRKPSSTTCTKNAPETRSSI